MSGWGRDVVPGYVPLDKDSETDLDGFVFVSSTVPEVTPANVSGGGGSKSELVITWEVNES